MITHHLRLLARIVLLRLILWSQLLPSMTATAAAQHTVISTVTLTATPTAPHPPSYTEQTIFQDTVLSTSNGYRKDHNASQLVWNEELTRYAQDWAKRCRWKHSNGPYGENLAFGYPNASSAVAAWGDEGVLYDYDKPTGFSEQTGHFTQLVWRASIEVGCAAVDCGYDTKGPEAKDSAGRWKKAQGWYVVCEYSPRGNVVGGSKALGGDSGLFRVNVQSASTYSGPYATTTALGPDPTTTSGVDGCRDAYRRKGGRWALGLWVVFLWAG